MSKSSLLFIYLIFFISEIIAQDWSVKISSNVELRTWKLSTKADKEEKPLLGASITLYQGSKIVSQGTSDSNGDFIVMVPGNGEYVLTVSYPSCNAKKFSIITTGVPAEIQKDNFKPSFSIGGFVMAKPFPGIDYSGLQQTLVKVVYEAKIKNFDDDEPYTDIGLGIVGTIAAAENALIEKFCSTNRSGDAALAKPDCPLAKMLYEKAIALIPGEQYPVVQLAKVGDCLKAAEETKKRTEAAALAKQEAIKAGKEKAQADKAAKEKSIAEKSAKDKLAKENTAAKKKTETDQAVKKKAAAEKAVKSNENNTMKAVTKADEPKSATTTGANAEFSGNTDKRDSKYKVPQVLGANKYKDALNRAEGYFKMKRFAEAKMAYEEVLKIKPGDSYATNKLTEINKLLSK